MGLMNCKLPCQTADPDDRFGVEVSQPPQPPQPRQPRQVPQVPPVPGIRTQHRVDSKFNELFFFVERD